MTRASVAALALAICAVMTARLDAQTRETTSDHEIVRVEGDLYRLRAGQQHTVFLVTPAGIILGDPLSAPTATWLKEELAIRFPDRPVRFVVLSSHHYWRAEGGGIFTDPPR